MRRVGQAHGEPQAGFLSRRINSGSCDTEPQQEDNLSSSAHPPHVEQQTMFYVFTGDPPSNQLANARIHSIFIKRARTTTAMQVNATDSTWARSQMTSQRDVHQTSAIHQLGVWESLHHHHNRHHTFNGLRGTGTRETWPLLFFFVLRIAMFHCCVYVPPRRGRSS